MRITGGQLQAANARTQADLMPLVNAADAHGAKFNETQRKLRRADRELAEYLG